MVNLKVYFVSKNNKITRSDVFEIRYKEKTGVTYLLVADEKKLKWIDSRDVEVINQ